MVELKVGQLVRIRNISECKLICKRCVNYNNHHRGNNIITNIHKYAVEGDIQRIATIDDYTSTWTDKTDHTICLPGYGYFTPEEVEVIPIWGVQNDNGYFHSTLVGDILDA